MNMDFNITKQLVEKIGGRIDVTSQLGQGANFTIKVPIQKP